MSGISTRDMHSSPLDKLAAKYVGVYPGPCNKYGLPQPMKPKAGSYTWDEIVAVLRHSRSTWFVQEKLDGIRARTFGGHLWAVSGKQIPNENIQKMFSGLPDGLDGELRLSTGIDKYGNRVYAPLHETNSVVMSKKANALEMRYTLFDMWTDKYLQYKTRAGNLWNMFMDSYTVQLPNLQLVSAIDLQNLEDIDVALTKLASLRDQWEREECEGFMLRRGDSYYKYGRCGKTNPELIRFKFWDDFEARLAYVHPQYHNTNNEETGEYGKMKRSHSQSGMEAMDTMGTLECVIPSTGELCFIGTGFSDKLRKQIWEKKDELEKFQPLVMAKRQKFGGKDKPRHPVFRCFRNPIDLS